MVDFSGSTCCTILIKGKTLFVANTGDSRAIIINAQKKITELSTDQTPSLPTEMSRIIKNGGVIHPVLHPTTLSYQGPARVWLPNQQVPGLAMSRSIGDSIAHSVGVIATPEVKEYVLGLDD